MFERLPWRSLQCLPPDIAFQLTQAFHGWSEADIGTATDCKGVLALGDAAWRVRLRLSIRLPVLEWSLPHPSSNILGANLDIILFC